MFDIYITAYAKVLSRVLSILGKLIPSMVGTNMLLNGIMSSTSSSTFISFCCDRNTCNAVNVQYSHY